ncbi:zinc finger BED domain-containing protein RICESLEEPER 2-like [Senna tora]|uniref:Zinc finger BED domain-containing protein RICESLEEPER 2-like n=1 Tax=Senna tora TaxID=362788 RepID=A0A834T1D7_9FABA|nr:zinc finger BED domain-containing protein RICESLEEPER 2-like [Senna tora]
MAEGVQSSAMENNQGPTAPSLTPVEETQETSPQQIGTMPSSEAPNENPSRIAITTDMWTSSNQNKGYMSITTHFIDDNWQLQSRLVRFIYVPAPHNAEVLCNVLVECSLDWNLDRKISTLRLDNCTTNDAMIDLLYDRIPTSSFILGGSLLHMRCCAHILNLIVKDGLSTIYDSIEKIRQSVAYWVATPKREEKFEETCRQLGKTYSRKLALDCRTRWNSTYLMLASALSYQEVFKRLKQHLVAEYQSKEKNSVMTLSDSATSTLTDVSSLSKQTKWDSGYFRFVKESACSANVKSELDYYLEETVLLSAEIQDRYDILAYWKIIGAKYPTLQKIARDFLAIPISAVASESAFSTGGCVLSPHRSRLNPNTVEALMCSQDWLRIELLACLNSTNARMFTEDTDPIDEASFI